LDTGQFIVRGILLIAVLVLLFFSQRYWFRQAWQLKQRISHKGLRLLVRSLLFGFFFFMILVASSMFFFGPIRRMSLLPILGMWILASLFAWLGIKVVRGAELGWELVHARLARAPTHRTGIERSPAALENPARRQFFQTATYFVGAVPFVGAVYGFASERLRFTLEQVEVPLTNLPLALDGMRVAQISDIHMSPYLTREQLRRAVDMANDLGAELAVVTGDFITTMHDPLEECVAEVARLRAPLGVWGCLGNHEIYADCEDEATELLRQVGVRVLRRQNAEITWNGQAFNLIGVDYQRSRGLDGRRLPMLPGVEPLVRRDVPNILLSHNPNAFERAADLGIEFTLAGHTHGGQVNVEILESQINAARFMTDYVAGLYSRRSKLTSQMAHLYVNRGIGTVGAPVRVNAPPEVTLLTLRRAS
jgi:predicted MPP superfamily phosphohydrolase